jgi:hypothetical protein
MPHRLPFEVLDDRVHLYLQYAFSIPRLRLSCRRVVVRTKHFGYIARMILAALIPVM